MSAPNDRPEIEVLGSFIVERVGNGVLVRPYTKDMPTLMTELRVFEDCKRLSAFVEQWWDRTENVS